MIISGTWDQETFAAAVGEDVWAPSVHNSQPWRFRRTGRGAEVLVDPHRPVADVVDAETVGWAGCGVRVARAR